MRRDYFGNRQIVFHLLIYCTTIHGYETTKNKNHIIYLFNMLFYMVVLVIMFISLYF